MCLLKIAPPIWLLKTFVYIVLGIWLLLILAAAVAALMERGRRKRFLCAHPQYNTVKIRRESNGYHIRTDIFSVNGERAIFSPTELLIPAGEVTIYADFVYADNLRDIRPAPLVDRDSPIGAFLELYHELFYKVPANDAGTYKITFTADTQTEYALKADPLAGEFLLTCIRGEDGEILHFKR